MKTRPRVQTAFRYLPLAFELHASIQIVD